MPDINFQHIVSCSSEDPHFPAKNLLSNRKWRTLKDGDSSATVIIQLEKETKISRIDIGNNGSAFVEVLVGKSSAPDKDYEVLLLNSSFMTPSESRSSSDMSRVRMFDSDKLCQDMAKQKWDRIKIVCQQSFNPRAQFGLSFIRMQAPADSQSTPTSALGRFAIRDEEEDTFVPGSLFAKRKEMPASFNALKTAAAAISDAGGSSPNLAGKTKAAVIIPKKRELPTNGSTPEAKKRMVQPPGTQNSPSERTGKYRKTLEGHSDEEEAKEEEIAAVTPKPKQTKNTATTTPKQPTKTATPTPKHPTKPATPKASEKKPAKKVEEPKLKIKRSKTLVPFKQLMKGVTFVLSGFQNPTRGILRDNATDMGAIYKGDWDKTCTHLIAAFPNTPKVKQVKAMGNGKIVTKEWIGQCFRKRTRFPWRRFALEKADQDDSESEEEILEDTTGASGSSSSRVEVVEDKDEELEEIYIADDDDNEPPSSQKTQLSDEYDADTDKDSDKEEVSKWPKLPEFFQGLHFTLHQEIPEVQRKKLKRYVVAAKGVLDDDLSDSTKFLVTDSQEGLSELCEFYPDVKAVKPNWVWQCFNNNKLAPFDDFLHKV